MTKFPGRLVACAAVSVAFILPVRGGAVLAAPPPSSAPAAFAPTASALQAEDARRIADLVTSNHILAHLGVVHAFGHVSVRSAANPHHFFMARSVAPERVTRADIIEYGEDSQPLDPRERSLYSERFIHGEIYRARPDVQSVMHSHTPAVLPFGVTSAPLKALIHTAYFLGTTPAPVFDSRAAMGEDNHMLVDTPAAGRALATALGDRSVVLMRGHGMTVTGPTLYDAVFRAVYTKANAEAELAALPLGPPVFMNAFEVQRSERGSREWEVWAAETR